MVVRDVVGANGVPVLQDQDKIFANVIEETITKPEKAPKTPRVTAANIVLCAPPSATICWRDNGICTAAGRPFLQNLAESVTIVPHTATGGAVIGIESSAAPAALLDCPIGDLLCTRFCALARVKLYWMTPAWSGPIRQGVPAASLLPVETQLLLIEIDNGKEFAVALPLIHDVKFRGSIRPPEKNKHAPGRMILRMESGDESVCAARFHSALYLLAGTDPYEILETGVAAAARLSGSAQARIEKVTPPILDEFGICTWDAWHTSVSAQGTSQCLAALAEGGIQARFVIIDDGWQHTGLDPELQGVDEGRTAFTGNPAEDWKKWSAEALSFRRRSAELLFSDNQIVEPLRALERQRSQALERQKSEGLEKTAPAQPSMLWRWASAGAAHVSTVLWRLQAAIISRLQGALETSSSDASSTAIFATAITGPLRKPLLRFYASASAHSRRLLSVKANGKFRSIDSGPEAPLTSVSDTFGEAIAELKERHGLHHVLCWHALPGYWSGCMPTVPGTAAFDPEITYPRPSPGTLEVDASMRWAHPAVVGVGLVKDPSALHQAMHEYLHNNGVDGVKCDVEATVAMLGWKSGGYAAIASRFHNSMEDSVAEHLAGNMLINSMCCSIEDLYNMKHSAIARVGEDFYPSLPASHTCHVANAAFTTLMIGPLATPDWDMFHSLHEAAVLHASARAICGGLVYVSDRLGEHDFSLLRRLVLPDGSVLRCMFPARPTLDCLFNDVSRDKTTVLKVFNQNALTGVIGAFNVQGSSWVVKRRNYFVHDPHPHALRVSVKPDDVHGLLLSDRYVLYSDALREVRVLNRNETWERELVGNGGCDLFVVSPLRNLQDDVEVAPIGLVNYLNAGGAIRSCHANQSSMIFAVKGVGEFWVYTSVAPKSIKLDGRPLHPLYDEARRVVVVHLEAKHDVCDHMVALIY